MKEGYDLSLQFRREVNEKVSARDDVQVGVGWVADDILRGEDDGFSQMRMNTVGCILLDEESLQPRFRDIRLNIQGVSSPAGNIDGLFLCVCGEDLELDLPGSAQIFQILLKHYGHGIGLFSRRAAHNPDA